MAAGGKTAPIPYFRQASGGIETRWSVTAPGVGPIEVTGSGDADLRDLPTDQEIAVQGVFELERSLFNDLIGAGDDPKDAARLVVLIQGASGRARCRTAAKTSADWSDDKVAKFELSWSGKKSDIAGDLVFSPCLVRTTKGVASDPPLASEPGEPIVTSSDALALLITQPDRSTGFDIEVKWVDFSEEPEKLPDDRPAAWKLQVPPSDGEQPVVYLDSGIENFRSTLESNARSGDTARKRELFLSTIAGETWSTLGAAALHAKLDSFSDGSFDASGEAADWQSRLILDIAMTLYPDAGREEGVQSLFEDYRDDPAATLAKLVSGKQARFKARQHVQRSVEDL